MCQGISSSFQEIINAAEFINRFFNGDARLVSLLVFHESILPLSYH